MTVEDSVYVQIKIWLFLVVLKKKKKKIIYISINTFKNSDNKLIKLLINLIGVYWTHIFFLYCLVTFCKYSGHDKKE